MRFVTQTTGKPKITWQQASTDTAAGLTAANLVSESAEQDAVALLITCETNDVRYALDGQSPTTSTGDGANFGHVLASGDAIILDNPLAIQNFQFVSKTAGSAGTLTITSFFAKL